MNSSVSSATCLLHSVRDVNLCFGSLDGNCIFLFPGFQLCTMDVGKGQVSSLNADTARN